MSITQLAIEKNRVTTAALLVVVLGGLGAYASLSRAKDPGFLIRVAQVTTIFPGASPERVEMLVTDKIEQVVKEIPELDFVASTSKTGASIVFVNVKEKYTDLQPIWDDLRRKIDGIRDDLPDGIIGPDVNDDFGDTYGIVVGITGDGFSYAELKDVADQVRDELLQIEEAAKVSVLGAQEERVFVEYNNATLAKVGLSPAALQQMLGARNIIIPGGLVTTGVERIALEPSGNFESIEDLRRTVVQIPGQRGVTYLEDIVDIRRGYVDPVSSEMRTNGAPSLGLAVSLREGGNIIDLGAKVEALLARLPAQYPHGIDFHVIAFEPTEVDAKISDFTSNVVQSIVIVLVVMLVFLGLRTGVLVASLIPTTMVMTLLIMSVLDIGLDQVSLASLIIALGMLVDNAIVMTESVMVQMREGKSAKEAAIASAAELRIPLLTSSLTTCAAFLPIYLAESTVGEYTNPLFKVVSIALLSSWVLALTMTPLLCVAFLKVKREDGGGEASGSGELDGILYRGYRRGLQAMLRHRAISISATVVVFAVAMVGFGFVRQLFFPNEASAQFTATFRLPVGTAIERTSEVMTDIEAFIEQELVVGEGRKSGVRNWATFIGAGAPKYALSYTPEPPAPEYAIMIVNATSPAAAAKAMHKLEAYTFASFPDLESKIKGPAAGPPVDNPIEVRISGTDIDKVFAIADDVKAKLRELRGPRNITDNWGWRTKKLELQVSQVNAYRAGLTNQDVAVSMLTNLSGFTTSQYREGDEVIPIVMRSVAADRQDLSKLETLAIYSQQTGRNVPLKQVATPHIEFEPSKIMRRDGLRSVSVRAQLDPGVTAAEVNAVLVPWLESRTWDIGYRYEIGGEAESSGKANASIGAKMPIAGFVILILLVAQFNSVRRTVIILCTIPLALIGVVIGLLGADSYFGFMTLLGVISLFGIVINNAIVLLERIKLEIDENGLEPARAIIVAAERRLRPILLTTGTTIGGLIPLWLGGGAMWEPMAIAIIFGLLFSTALTLGVVPVLYSALFRVRV